MKAAVLILLVCMTGCALNDDTRALTDKIVCTKDGAAYLMKHNVGDNLFANRMHEADSLCSALAKATTP